MSDHGHVTLTQQQDYRFELDFGEHLPPVHSDEPAPLGGGTGPNPAQLLAAAVGNCLAASLLFSFRKFKQEPSPLTCVATPQIGRNDAGRVRVLRIDVTLTLGVPAVTLEHADRVLDQFEMFCTVSQSVAQGIPIALTVCDADGTVLKAPQ